MKLLGISKRGNPYLRKLFVQGARAVPQFREQLCFRSEHMAGATHIANTLQRRRRGAGQQAGAHGLGRARQERSLSASDAGRTVLLLDWPADGAWLKPGLEIACAIPTSTAQRLRLLSNDSRPGLLANNEMAQRSNPALFKSELGKSPSRLRY